MTAKELIVVKTVLEHIKTQDARVAEALAYLAKDLAIREQQRGNFLRDDDYDYSPW